MSATRAAARPARTLMVLAALVLLPGCMTEKPVVEATGVPVGAGVDVPPGSNEDVIVNVGRRIYFDESSADINDTARVTLRKQAGSNEDFIVNVGRRIYFDASSAAIHDTARVTLRKPA